jgi:uncharacterized protein (TIGR02145 family)
MGTKMRKLIISVGIAMIVPFSLSAETVSDDPNSMEGTVKDMEGNTYSTIRIGKQMWLAENLRSTKYQDGSNIKTAFVPNDDEDNLRRYGRLYDWHDVSDGRNICPVGWRVASDEDWKELERTIGMSEEDLDRKGWRGEGDIAITLKESQPDTLFRSFDQTKVNAHKLNIRPSGIKWKKWYFTQGIYGEYWTSSEATEEDAFNRTFAHSWWNCHKGEIYRTALSKTYMFAVRCVKN